MTPHSVRMMDVVTGRTETITWLRDENWLVVTDDGHYRCSPSVEGMLVYVAETDDGSQEILSPQEFSETYNWHNTPEQVQFQD